MEKSADAYRTISEVAQDLDLPQHVLRFWETRFIQIKPMKRGGGRRYYRPEDIELLRAIRHLLYGEGYTIKGVQKILKEQGARAIAANFGGAGPLVVASAERIAQDFEDDWDDEPAEMAVATAAEFEIPSRPSPSSVPAGATSNAPLATSPKPVPTAPSAPVAAPASPAARSVPGLRESLQDLATELAECARLLDTARGNSGG